MGRVLPPSAREAWKTAKVLFALYDAKNNKARPYIDFKGQWVVDCGPVPDSPAYVGRWATFKNLGNAKVCGLLGQALPLSGEVQDIEPTQDTLLLAKHSGDTVFDRWQDIMFAHRVGLNGKGVIYWPRSANLFPKAVPVPIPVPEVGPLPEYIPSPRGYQVPAVQPMPAAVPRERPGVYSVHGVRPNTDNWPKPARGQVGSVVVVAPPTVTNPIRKPPGPGVKERKFRMAPGALVGALGVAAGEVS